MRAMVLAAGVVLGAATQGPGAAKPVVDQAFKVPVAGEAVAVIHASCSPCDWGVEGKEAAAALNEKAAKAEGRKPYDQAEKRPGSSAERR